MGFEGWCPSFSTSLDEVLRDEKRGLLAAMAAHIVGGLSYCSDSIRVDAQYVCQTLARHICDWQVFDDRNALQSHCYIEETIEVEQVCFVSIQDFLHGTLALLGDADASYAGDIRNMKRTVSYMVILLGRHGTRSRLRTRCRRWPQVCFPVEM